MSNHPEPSALLRHIDGELPSRKSRQIERHLEACWDCRAESEALKQTMAECVRYRKQFLSEALPEPPQLWAGLEGGFDRIDRQVTPQATGLLRLVRGTGSPWRWAVGAATAALAVAGALYFGGTPSKKAPAPPISVQEPQLLRHSADSGAAPLEVPPRPAVPSGRPQSSPDPRPRSPTSCKYYARSTGSGPTWAILSAFLSITAAYWWPGPGSRRSAGGRFRPPSMRCRALLWNFPSLPRLRCPPMPLPPRPPRRPRPMPVLSNRVSKPNSADAPCSTASPARRSTGTKP